MRTLARTGHGPCHREIVDRPLHIARQALAHPVVVEWHRIELGPVLAERVEIAVPDPRPIDELDAKLERSAGLAHESRLVDAQALVEVLDRRDGDRKSTRLNSSH